MTKVTAQEFSADISSAIMDKGEMGIQNVLTQYMFGEKKFLTGLFDNAVDDRERLGIVSQVITDIKKVYQEGGEPSLNKLVRSLMNKADGIESL